MVTQPILVTYATRHGSTGEVAEEIASVLRESGARVTVRPMNDVFNLIPYKAVILGSAEYKSALLPEAIQFVRTHQTALSKLPVAYFVVSMTLAQPTVEVLDEASHYLDPVYASAPKDTLVAAGMFAGSVRSTPWNLFWRLLGAFQSTPCGDFRNWEEIRRWTTSVHRKLAAAA